ncbi:hypothetical protein CSUI_005322, partial [Cystoisospora suis]
LCWLEDWTVYFFFQGDSEWTGKTGNCVRSASLPQLCVETSDFHRLTTLSPPYQKFSEARKSMRNAWKDARRGKKKQPLKVESSKTLMILSSSIMEKLCVTYGFP